MSGALAAPDPTAGASPAPPDDASGPNDADDNVICTITSDGQGGFMVYAGDEPDNDQGDQSEDDADTMGNAGAAPAPTTPTPQGQPADSVGAALKIVMTILQGNGSSGEDQFAAGFSGSQAPTPTGMGAPPMAQKF